MEGNGNFTGYLDASNSVAVTQFDREQLTSLMHFPAISECLGWRTTDFEELYGDLGQWTMTKELAREVSGLYLSSHCEVWWIAELILNMSRPRADRTMSSWLLYFRNFTKFHTVSYIIWTPLWTKCARAATILSNISANACVGLTKDDNMCANPQSNWLNTFTVRASYILPILKWFPWWKLWKNGGWSLSPRNNGNNQNRNQFVFLSFGVDPLNWKSFIEIGELACSTTSWCSHGQTLNTHVRR